MRRVRVTAAGLSFALVAAACSSGGGHKGVSGAIRAVFRMGIPEPTAIDPYNSQDDAGELVTKAVFEGLVTLDPSDASLKPGVASTWDHDAACRTWTFHLIPGTKFSNNEAVTAQSFIDGMNRAARQAAASDTAEFMSDVAGYADVHGSKKKGAPPATARAMSGLSAPDANTLVISLSQPNCELDRTTLQPVFSPVPSSAGDGTAKSAFGDGPIGNGPFMMKGAWQHDHSITLVRNPQYHGPAPRLSEVDLTILPAEGAQQAEYKTFQAGGSDWSHVPPALLPQAKTTYGAKGELIGRAQYGVSFLVPEVTTEPLKAADARKAISLAIDRDAVISGVFGGFKTKATSLVPPPLAAYFQPGVCATCVKSDPVQAKALAAKAGLRPGTQVTLELITGQGNDDWVQAVRQQLRQVLGLDVVLVPKPLKEAIADMGAPAASGLFQAAWFADYPSADDFLRPLLSQGSLPPGNNRGRYVNPRVDVLLDQAVASRDQAEKVRLTREAERIAIGEDQALIPLWYSTQYRVFSDRFTGVTMDFFNNPTLATIAPK